MRHAYLIARQEFIKYVTRRGFALSILMFPLWILIVLFVPKWTGATDDQSPRHVFTVVDRSGGDYSGAITDALARANAYRATPWDYAPAPAWLAGADAAHLRSAIREAFVTVHGRGRTGEFLDTVVVVPSAVGRGAAVQVWSRQKFDPAFRGFLEDAIAGALRYKAVRAVAPQFNDPGLLAVSVPMLARDPDSAAARDSALDTIVPVALAIILFVVSVMNASVLLQGVVEEKSTRMIEVLLSCATPREIIAGKLIGVIAVALTTLIIWALVLFALMALADHDTVALVFASLKAVAALDTLPLLLVFFLCGLLIYGSLFLAIGSMANSLADAQSLLGPSMLILMMPNVMIAAVIRDPNGPLATTLSWVPIYTPFFMMLRIASHPPVWQLWGTVALALATTVALIAWSSRVFARNVLTTERPPSLGKLLSGLMRRA